MSLRTLKAFDVHVIGIIIKKHSNFSQVVFWSYYFTLLSILYLFVLWSSKLVTQDNEMQAKPTWVPQNIVCFPFILFLFFKPFFFCYIKSLCLSHYYYYYFFFIFSPTWFVYFLSLWKQRKNMSLVGILGSDWDIVMYIYWKIYMCSCLN